MVRAPTLGELIERLKQYGVSERSDPPPLGRWLRRRTASRAYGSTLPNIADGDVPDREWVRSICDQLGISMEDLGYVDERGDDEIAATREEIERLAAERADPTKN